MKLLLKQFQTDAVDKFVRRLRGAARDASDDLQSVALSSPTGSGKTVIAAAVIERLLGGDEDFAPMPDATFLWITDQPELNEQTRRKMLEAGTLMDTNNLIVIDNAFDREEFAPGKVYFLNTQKLGKNSLLVAPGDKRTHTLWETIANTVCKRPRRFFLFIDEAHRGMAQSAQARNEVQSIVQKFIKGSVGEIPPVPLIVGISATPGRFHALVAGTERSAHQVNVPVEEVRGSGLLKERITLYYPHKEQYTDMTLLRKAVGDWRNYIAQWQAYCQAQDEPTVRPVFAVQVRDASGKQITQTDLGEVMQIIQESGALPPLAFAHAFQEGSKISAGGQDVRYLAPSDIDRDPDVQVVFFKSSLNTGWDCPRAEVMMSFRAASDATLIAQLVGRMVRTPLARRIETDEHLNTVSLYLPHYNAKEVKNVVNHLTGPDSDLMTPTEVSEGDDTITLERAPDTEALFAALKQMPSYIVPSRRKSSEVARVMKLGRLLANDAILADGPEQTKSTLLDVLMTAYAQQISNPRFQKIVSERGRIEILAAHWQVGADMDDTRDTIIVDIAPENINELFEAAGRKIGEGLHKEFWRRRVEQDSGAKTSGKLELFALCLEPDILKDVETAAQKKTQQWLQEYRFAINGLPAARLAEYNEIRQLAQQPELTNLTYPDRIESKREETSWAQHLYVDEQGQYSAKLNSWEAKVLEEELERPSVIGWLRNVPRKSWALCIPYEQGGVTKAMYPDFLIFREAHGGILIDVLEPHRTTESDAPAKAAGLAKFADKHADEFGRIEYIIVEGDNIRRLNLCDQPTRNRVRAVSTHEHLEQLLQES